MSRIAIVYDCLAPLTRGGGELVYRALAEDFARRGVDVDYVTRDLWSPEGPPEGPFEVVGIWSGDIYDQHGTRRATGAVHFAVAVFRFFRKRKQTYDLVVASALPMLTVLAARAALGGRATLVADWLEVWPAAKWRRYAGAAAGTVASVLQWLAARVVRFHTVNSPFTASQLRAVNPRAHPEAFDLASLVAPGRSEEAAQPPYLLAVGRLIPDKRFTAIPAALAVARQRVPALRVVMVGVGPDFVSIEHEARRHGVEDAVVFAGEVSDHELARLRSAAAGLVHPSAREGFGLVVLEALANGVPAVVVAGAENAAVDLVEDGINGRVATDASPASLGEAMAEVVLLGNALRDSTRRKHESSSHEASLSATVLQAISR